MSKEIKQFDSCYDFTKKMSNIFSKTIGSDYYNGSMITVEIELLEGYTDRNIFIQYLIDDKDVKLGEEVLIYYNW